MSKAIMTIHGFLTVKEDFGALYNYLDCYDEVLAVEIPGHNGEVDFSLFTVESTLQAVLNAFDSLRSRHDQVDVVGFSMGGALTTWLCTQRDVHRAVMLAPSDKFINAMMPFNVIKYYCGFRMRAYRQAQGSPRAKRKAVKQSFAPYAANIAAANKIAKERTFKYMGLHTLSVFTKLMKLARRQVRTHAPISTPALVLWGKLDELVPYASVKFLLKRFPNVHPPQRTNNRRNT